MPSVEIEITIIGDRSAEVCEGKCGLDWSLPEVITLAEEQVKSRFNRDAAVKYVDLDQAPDTGVRFKGQPLPALLVNGQLRVSGRFDMRMLLDAVDTELEISGGRRK